MKNYNLFTLLTALTLAFSSCSFNETVLPEEEALDLLKTYTIKRDASGAYSLDYSLNNNVETENVVDETTNTNYIYLYPVDNAKSKKVTQNLIIDGSELKIGFVDTNTSKQPQITVKDLNATLAKVDNQEMLSEYSVSGNEDGTYTLDFTVTNKVQVDFIYNDESNIYEVHLKEGKSNETNFSKIFNKIEGETLKIDFVNFINDNTTSAKSTVGDDPGYTYTKERRPEVIII